MNKSSVYTYHNQKTDTYCSFMDKQNRTDYKYIGTNTLSMSSAESKIVVYFEETASHDGYCTDEKCEYETKIYAKIVDANLETDYMIHTNSLEHLDWSHYCSRATCPVGVEPLECHACRITVIDTHTIS